MENQVASTVLAVGGAVFFSIQLIPQIVLNYRRHHARGLNSSMMLLWALSGVPLGVYTISRPLHIALQVQPQLLSLLSLITWGQCLWYNRRWSLKSCLLATIGVGSALSGVEVGLVFALLRAKEQHLEWPFLFMAVLSAALLSTGVIRHYVDIWRHKTVRGISFLFIAIDALGDLTSALALVFAAHIDWPGVAIYAFEFVLWMGIYTCAWWLGVEKDDVGAAARSEGERDGGIADEPHVHEDPGCANASPDGNGLALTPVPSGRSTGSVRSRMSVRTERSMTIFRTASRDS